MRLSNFLEGILKNSISNKKLLAYRESSGGDMQGGYSSVSVATVDGMVILTYSDSKWHYEDQNIKEYCLDPGVFNDLDKVIRKYKINTWNGKKFSNVFVADGASYSYSFDYEGGVRISFSSQMYPASYSNKLKELHSVIDKYKEKATPLPGLVTKEKKEEEKEEEKSSQNYPDSGKIVFEVYEYSKNWIYYRFLNGTDEDMECEDNVKLVDSDDKELYSKSHDGVIKVNAHSTYEDSCRLTHRLDEGNYYLTIGKYKAEFIIKKN